MTLVFFNFRYSIYSDGFTCCLQSVIIIAKFIDKPDCAQYNKIVVPEDEAYGANCIWVHGTGIVAEGYPTVLKAVQDLGYKTLVVDTSEYRKVDGGLSCLSLRF